MRPTCSMGVMGKYYEQNYILCFIHTYVNICV